MNIDNFNEDQIKKMSQSLSKDKYNWENQYLNNILIGVLPLERIPFRTVGKELSHEEQEQTVIINSINKIVNDYNSTFIIKKDEINELKTLYNKLDKYIDRLYTSYSEIINCLSFNKKILLTGPGGTGKSQFLYEFIQLIKNKFEFLIIFGKFCDDIHDSIFDDIDNITTKDKFFLIIDAINELDDLLRDKILKYVLKNKENENLRVIISLRDFSMSEIEISTIKDSIDIEEIFAGVSPEDAINKIADKYNLDLSIYSKLLYDNNPLHLKLIINEISKNKLTSNKLNSISRGTYIYENFIKSVLDRNDWLITKKIVKLMYKNKAKKIEIASIKISKSDLNNYIKRMKSFNFIGTYTFEKIEYLYFVNEILTDYLIARFLFDDINQYTIQNEIKYINQIIEVFYTIQVPLILMLFDKYNKNIDKALNIILKSNLNDYLNIETFNECNFSQDNIKIILKRIVIQNDIKYLIVHAGGNENNPFNFTNYLNKKMKKIRSINFDRYDYLKIESKLKIYIQTIGKFDYSEKYICEKFWFAFWCSISVNKNIRFLCKKLILEIANSNSNYIKILIDQFYINTDEYIKEMIIHVLSSLKKNNNQIISFFNMINTKDELNIRNIYYISNYLYSFDKCIKFNKKDLLCDKDIYINHEILEFIHSIFFINKHDYEFFGFDSYNSKISFSTKFLSYDKNIITKINEYILKNFSCLNSNYCNSAYFKDIFIDKIFAIDDYKLIEDKEIYLAWQKKFKQYLNKFKIKIKDLKLSRAYEEKDKNLAYKALDLSLADINGSISCNYYTNSFEFFDKYKVGYQPNLYDKYGEKQDLNYPVAVFNEFIENIDRKLEKRIRLPKSKDLAWVKNEQINLENIKNMLNPINYNNEEWMLIYGNIRIDEKANNQYGSLWIDTYIINMAIDESYNLSKLPDNDRKYTIETKEYRGNMHDYIEFNNSQTTSLYKSTDMDNNFLTTDYNLPPSILISEFNLHYDKATSSWKNNSNEIVILSNNNEGIWYKKGCSGTIYMRKKYYDILRKKHSLKFFCFTEKFIPSTGYCHDSAMQIQINVGRNIIKYKHYRENNIDIKHNQSCEKCECYKREQEDLNKMDKIPPLKCSINY